MSTDSKFLELLADGLVRAGAPNGASLVVAFSGGPDSTALLAGLAELGKVRKFKLLAAHVNHQIRAESSNKDQLAAENIAGSLGVGFTSTTIDVPQIAAERKISIESAARQERYKVLAQIVESTGAIGVVTGHTRNDQAETVLLHAMRGAGLKGISGMRHRSVLRLPEVGVALTVLRPMLDTSRNECVEYCEQVRITPVIDESNSSRDYKRNQIRLDVLPLLDDVTPGSSRALARLAENAADDLEVIDWIVSKHLDEARTGEDLYSRASVRDLPQNLVARMLLRAYEVHVGHSQNLERVHVSDMIAQLQGRSGTSLKLPNQTKFFVDKSSFGFASPGDDDCPYPLSFEATEFKFPGVTQCTDGFTVSAEIIDRPDMLTTGTPLTTYATPELISHSLKLRNRTNGDRFQPLGMGSRVKLQDFFVDAGVPQRWRDRVPIIESDQGIVWIAGYRLAEWAKVLPGHTKVARLELRAPGY
jgi:tRNA(Ile)-lysidine synthase